MLEALLDLWDGGNRGKGLKVKWKEYGGRRLGLKVWGLFG